MVRDCKGPCLPYCSETKTKIILGVVIGILTLVVIILAPYLCMHTGILVYIDLSDICGVLQVYLYLN